MFVIFLSFFWVKYYLLYCLFFHSVNLSIEYCFPILTFLTPNQYKLVFYHILYNARPLSYSKSSPLTLAFVILFLCILVLPSFKLQTLLFFLFYGVNTHLYLSTDMFFPFSSFLHEFMCFHLESIFICRKNSLLDVFSQWIWSVFIYF